jgi:hypothetical protein
VPGANMQTPNDLWESQNRMIEFPGQKGSFNLRGQ